MNLFVTHSCPKKSAKYLDDKRVVKMLLETAQLLCTTAWELGIEAPYKPTHRNHPVTKWVRDSRDNFIWTCQYFAALSDQYLCRYGKFHKSYMTVLECGVLTTVAMTGNFGKESLTDFANCAANSTKGLSYKHVKDVHVAYRKYLRDLWQNHDKNPKLNKKGIKK